MKARKRLPTVLLVAALVVGIAVLAYPSFSDWWNSSRQTKALAVYSNAVNETDQRQREELLAAARAFNDEIPSRPVQTALSQEERAAYNALLDLSGTGIMGSIQIPALGVDLPIYHGTEESALQVAIGHLDWSSLPIGGPWTHTVLTGHRGLPSARLFTDLDRLRLGDVFTLTVLDQTLTYQVDQIVIVEPDDLSELGVIPGGDYCTLLTCTPYSINTHRLLVRGVRIENAAEAMVIVPDASRMPTSSVLPLVLGLLTGLVLLALLIPARLRRRPLEGDQKAALLARLRSSDPHKKS